MLSKPIFKQTLRANIRLWLIFTLVTSVLNLILISVFEPSSISSFTEFVEGTPLANLLKDTTFLGMLAQTFYSIHGVLLPLIFAMMTANSLVSAQIDRGSMAYLLSTPTKRTTVVRTQAIYLIISLILMFTIITTVGIVAIELFQSDVDLDKGTYLMLNLGLFLLIFANSSVSFMFSCIFNLSKNSLAFGAGIPLAFFILQLMAQVDSSLENFKYFTLNSLFNTEAILDGDGYLIQFIVLAIVGIVLYIIGVRVFKEKDLPL